MHARKSKSEPLRIFALAVGILTIAAVGCNNNSPPKYDQRQNAAAIQAADESQDPAEQANLAPAVQTDPPPSGQDFAYNASDAGEQVTDAPGPPPPLPEYEQPAVPGPNYIWTPGSWNYAKTGYYWVPGRWVLAPYIGALWTPGYWGFYNGRYLWHPGYWGPHTGFYGGINYGHGYTGIGYVGGYWENDSFKYNSAITHVDPAVVHNTYSHRVRVVRNPRISYNGGRGGLTAHPLTSERVAAREHHMGPLPGQQQHREEARRNPAQWASRNHGQPKTMAISQPLNAGRQQPDAMPPAVQEQVLRERQGHRPARPQERRERPKSNGVNRQR